MGRNPMHPRFLIEALIGPLLTLLYRWSSASDWLSRSLFIRSSRNAPLGCIEAS